MTDRELLELAAKAAGYELYFVEVNINNGPDNAFYFPHDYDHEWNPLDDDGDALRLAVKLNLRLEIWYQDFMHDNEESTVEWSDSRGFDRKLSEKGPDQYAATRRAIVRAAASIAQSMNQETPGRKSP